MRQAYCTGKINQISLYDVVLILYVYIYIIIIIKTQIWVFLWDIMNDTQVLEYKRSFKTFWWESFLLSFYKETILHRGGLLLLLSPLLIYLLPRFSLWHLLFYSGRVCHTNFPLCIYIIIGNLLQIYLIGSSCLQL